MTIDRTRHEWPHAQKEAPQEAHSAVAPSVAPSPGSGAIRGVHVLVVDDDADLRDAMCAALEVEEASVVSVGSVDEALSALDRDEQLEVVVSDIGMPKRDGYDLIRSVRSRSPDEGGDLPAIALTAFPGGETRERSLKAGFQCCAQKPIHPRALVAAIAMLAGRHEGR